MDRPVLHAFVGELADHERLAELADALPTHARVSEAALPVLLAALHERVDDRGQFAVRGGLIDVFPTTGREPLRIEFFGDEVESIRAFSPFTQRALHPVDACTVYPAVERRLDLVAEWLPPPTWEEGEVR